VGVSKIELEMWDEAAMPGRGERVRDLLAYAAGKYPGMDASEACESAAAATGAYSFRGYCTWGSKEERAAVDAAVAARRVCRFAVVESMMLCRARQSVGVEGQTALAAALGTLPSGIVEMIAAAMVKV
jgi:hypothetical protein